MVHPPVQMLLDVLNLVLVHREDMIRILPITMMSSHGSAVQLMLLLHGLEEGMTHVILLLLEALRLGPRKAEERIEVDIRARMAGDTMLLHRQEELLLGLNKVNPLPAPLMHLRHQVMVMLAIKHLVMVTLLPSQWVHHRDSVFRAPLLALHPDSAVLELVLFCNNLPALLHHLLHLAVLLPLLHQEMLHHHLQVISHHHPLQQTRSAIDSRMLT